MSVLPAAEFFATVRPGQRFRLIDPTGQSLIPGPGDILTAGEMAHDDEFGEVRLFTYEDGEEGAFAPGDDRMQEMKFELVEA